MNPQTTPPQTAVVVAPKREIRVVEDDSPLAYIMDTAKFEHCYRIAEAMSRASLIPQHLKGGTKEETAANCFLVVNQALRWHMDPFLIAPETYAIQGKLGYQGKLVAAVINTRANLAEKLRYDFSGTKGTDDYTVTVSGRFEGEAEPRTVSVSVGQAKTQNQMWTKDPEQKLVYTGSIRWARRHKPEIIMGVVTDDDLDAVREQAMIDGMKQVKSPVFDGPPPALPEGSDSSTVPPTPSNETPGEKELRELNDALKKLCADAAISEEQLVSYMRAEKWLKRPEQKKPSDMAGNMLKLFIKGWQSDPAGMVKNIQAVLKKV
jgi:hypothetical protein